MEKSAKSSFFLSNLANNITVGRILLVPAFILSLLYYAPGKEYLRMTAVFIFLAACLSDAVDGYIARKFDQKTVLGSYIDPIADKLLLSSGFLSLSFMQNLPEAMRIPGWLTISVISRDVIIIIGSTLIFLATGSLKAAPLFVGKITTVLQMATLCAVLLEIPQPLIRAFFFMTVFFTLISGLLYIRVGEKIFQPAAHDGKDS